jgi:D-tyrosyl-tRNA(Tyr) deacylase
VRAVVQRVKRAKVTVGDRTTGEIGAGLLVFLGVSQTDGLLEVEHLARKVGGLRIFEDEAGKFNLAAHDVGAEFLVVSQFTLYADCERGFRPSFSEAARPEIAAPLYESFVSALRSQGHRVETGEFQAHMLVESENDGPVTIILENGRKGGA